MGKIKKDSPEKWPGATFIYNDQGVMEGLVRLSWNLFIAHQDYWKIDIH